MILRKATLDDKEDLLRWRNDALTVANSFDSREIPFQEHEVWFNKALRDPNRLLLIGLEDDNKIGMVRFDCHGGYYEISINISPDFRGQGKGMQLLNESLHWVKGRVLARVKKENLSSIRFFEKAGFGFKKEEDDHIEFELIRPTVHLTTKAKIVAIVPAFNEERTISWVLKGLKPYVQEIIVIDDGSSDNTPSIAHKEGAIVISHARKEGYDRSIADGFAIANEHKADIVFTFDGDSQHRVEDVPKLIAPIINDEADVVVGRRTGYARISEYLYAWIARKKAAIDDPLCGLKVYRMDVYRDVGYFDRIGSIGTELVFNAKKKGYRIVQQDIVVNERQDDSRFGKKLKANFKIFMAIGRTILKRD